MATTTTFKLLLEQLVEETSTGDVLPGVTGTTTGLTLANAYAAGPFPNQRYARGSPILTTAGTAINEATFVNQYTASTGVFTITPSVSGTFTDAIIIPFSIGIDHPDRLKEAINRALTKRCYRWEPRPLTYVPDGDLQGTTVTDYWTAAANGTPAYASAQVFPAGSAADAVGQTSFNRFLQLTTSGGSSSVDGNGIRVVASNEQRAWYFQTTIRLVSGAGTAEFKVRDNTNSADITLQVTRGNDTNTLTTTTFGDFMVCEGTFQLPATCAEIAPRLSVSATTMVAQMGPVIMFPQQATRFPLPNRVVSQDDIGNFHQVYSGNSGSFNQTISTEALTTGGLAHRLEDYGDHMTVSFNFRPTRPVYYMEAVYGTSLSAMTDTTTFPANHVMRWAKYELYKWLYDRDEKWKMKVYEAKKAADRFDVRHLQEPTIVGRV